MSRILTMEGPLGLEPRTPCLKGRCSNRLSYGPVSFDVRDSCHAVRRCDLRTKQLVEYVTSFILAQITAYVNASWVRFFVSYAEEIGRLRPAQDPPSRHKAIHPPSSHTLQTPDPQVAYICQVDAPEKLQSASQ